MENARASDIRRLEEEIRSLRAEIVGLKKIVLSSGPETIQNNGDSGCDGISASDSGEVQPPPSLGGTPFALVARMMTYLSSTDCITFTTACMMMPNEAGPTLEELNKGARDSAPMRAAFIQFSTKQTQVENEGEEVIGLNNGGNNHDELMEEVAGAMKRKSDAAASAAIVPIDRRDQDGSLELSSTTKLLLQADRLVLNTKVEGADDIFEVKMQSCENMRKRNAEMRRNMKGNWDEWLAAVNRIEMNLTHETARIEAMRVTQPRIMPRI